MTESNRIIEALYNNFLLRDLFAKIVPGSVVLVVIAYQSPLGKDAVEVANQIGWPAVFIGAGIAWIIGFALQQIGESLRIIKHHPDKFADSKDRYKLRTDFMKIATPSESQQAERYTIIKEASGNSATALFTALLIVIIRSLLSSTFEISLSTIFPGVILLLFAIALVRTNRNHARRQYEFIEIVIATNKSDV